MHLEIVVYDNEQDGKYTAETYSHHDYIGIGDTPEEALRDIADKFEDDND